MNQNEARQNPRTIVIQKLYGHHLNKDSEITFPKHRYKKFIKDVVNGTIERKELAFFQSLITKTKIDILDYSLDFINKLEEKIKSYEEISKRLDNILLSFSKNKSDKEPLEYLEEVDQVWLDVIQGNFKQIFSRDFDFKLPLLKELVKEPKESRNQEYYNETKK